jgi:hypothetical protein
MCRQEKNMQEWFINGRNQIMRKLIPHEELVRLYTGIERERAEIAAEARRYAGHYPPSSDGRNTFILLAEWIEARGGDQQQRPLP